MKSIQGPCLESISSSIDLKGVAGAAGAVPGNP